MLGLATAAMDLRSGRGSDCDKIGGLAADDAVSLVGCTPDGKWYQVELGSGVVVLLWIAPSHDLAGGEL